jgi:hypothetical protein
VPEQTLLLQEAAAMVPLEELPLTAVLLQSEEQEALAAAVVVQQTEQLVLLAQTDKLVKLVSLEVRHQEVVEAEAVQQLMHLQLLIPLAVQAEILLRAAQTCLAGLLTRTELSQCLPVEAHRAPLEVLAIFPPVRAQLQQVPQAVDYLAEAVEAEEEAAVLHQTTHLLEVMEFLLELLTFAVAGLAVEEVAADLALQVRLVRLQRELLVIQDLLAEQVERVVKVLFQRQVLLEVMAELAALVQAVARVAVAAEFLTELLLLVQVALAVLAEQVVPARYFFITRS